MGVPVSASRGFVCLEQNEVKWSSESSRTDYVPQRPSGYKVLLQVWSSVQLSRAALPRTPGKSNGCKQIQELWKKWVYTTVKVTSPELVKAGRKQGLADVSVVVAQATPHYAYTQRVL